MAEQPLANCLGFNFFDRANRNRRNRHFDRRRSEPSCGNRPHASCTSDFWRSPAVHSITLVIGRLCPCESLFYPFQRCDLRGTMRLRLANFIQVAPSFFEFHPQLGFLPPHCRALLPRNICRSNRRPVARAVETLLQSPTRCVLTRSPSLLATRSPVSLRRPLLF
jgi:hypothetical protein